MLPFLQGQLTQLEMFDEMRQMAFALYHRDCPLLVHFDYAAVAVHS